MDTKLLLSYLPSEKQVLEKGLNFALTPKIISIPEMIALIEDGLKNSSLRKSQQPQ